jgi:hypothetical protein
MNSTGLCSLVAGLSIELSSFVNPVYLLGFEGAFLRVFWRYHLFWPFQAGETLALLLVPLS